MRAILFSLAVLSTNVVADVASVAGVLFQPTLAVQNQQLQLDGAGLLRWKGLFKIYAAGLYREDPKAGFDLDSNEIQVLEIEYLRSVNVQGFVDATRLGLQRTLPAGESISQWESSLAPFLAAYQDVVKGDRYQLAVTETFFTLALNGQELYRSEDTALGRRLLGVWLDERSLSPSLREALLASN